jgi:Tol biopolymer transport system component
MALTSGSRVGGYEIVAAIGAGGMGEVYRARDSKLGREVAVKILPESVANDPERVARFAREAHLLAALNHQNIAHIYGFEEQGATRALVMELVEGPTLADRLRDGPLLLDEALAIARQILDALETAHAHGIVHRDLKPANIKVRDDGMVKVLDFGLAKAIESTPTLSPSAVTNSPTITSPAMTARGIVLGTAAYMAPEQAKGKAVDKRADMWAFGCVVFEMLTSRRAFDGEDTADTIAAVLTKFPEWNTLPADTPHTIRNLLEKCCEKDLKRRVPDSSVARWMIEHPVVADSGITGHPSRLRLWATAAAVVVVFGIGWSAVWAPVQDTASLRLNVDLGADVSLLPVTQVGGVQRGVGTSVVLSPDGRQLAFVATNRDGLSQLYLRSLDQLFAAALPGTAGAAAPFFSPDGQWIGFFAERSLKKISAAGGVPTTLCEVPMGRGGTWSEDNFIVYTPSSLPGAHLLRVAAAGGTPEPFTRLAPGESVHRWPQALPGRAGVLFTSSPSNTGPYDAADLVVVSASGGDAKVVHRGGSDARYVASGHILFVNDGTLFALPFDLKGLVPTGRPVPILEGVSYGRDNGAAQFSVSKTGTLAYVSGATGELERQISWLDRSGIHTALRSTPTSWGNLQFAPDGRRLAADIGGAGNQRDIWIINGESSTRLTFGGSDNFRPVWTDDGEGILFVSNRGSNRIRNIYWQRADGSGEPVALTSGDTSKDAFSWHPTGRFLAFTEASSGSRGDISVMEIAGTVGTGFRAGLVTSFVKTAADELRPAFSPDGKWLAYVSDESGRPEVYVRPFPDAGGKWLVSTGGGQNPEWSRRSELIYQTPDRRLMVVPYSIRGGAFVASPPQSWSPRPHLITNRGYALHPDGNRIAFETPSESVFAPVSRVTLVTGFFDELRRVAPEK